MLAFYHQIAWTEIYHVSTSFAAERPSHLFETQNNGEAQYALVLLYYTAANYSATLVCCLAFMTDINTKNVTSLSNS